jgi:hypothetical protein
MASSQSTLTIYGTLYAPSGGTINYAPIAPSNPNNVAQGGTPLNLTTTPQLVTLPANTLWFGIEPPPNNDIPISHKWSVGDTGSVINMTYGIPCCGVDPSHLTFYIWAASDVTVTLWSA